MNRTRQVTWNSSLSKPCSLDTGIPQGSVPGLLLLSLYARSLGSIITSHGFSYLLSFHSSDSLIATCISGRHQHLDDCTSPEAQPWQDWAPLCAGEGLPSHGPTGHRWGHCGMSFTNCEEPWRGTGQSAVLHGQHHLGGPISQTCTLQHPQDPALPHEGSSIALGPCARHLPPRILQPATPGWTPIIREQTSAAYPEPDTTTRVQPTEILPCDPPLPRPPLPAL